MQQQERQEVRGREVMGPLKAGRIDGYRWRGGGWGAVGGHLGSEGKITVPTTSRLTFFHG